MAHDLLSRYIWLIDTIRSYKRITRDELNSRWRRSRFSAGDDLPRRTFYNYRQAIEDLFQINIGYDPRTFEYFIEADDIHNESMTNWLLNSAAMNNVLSDSRRVADRIFLENIPSARAHLPLIIEAIKDPRVIRFTYQPFSRVNPSPGIMLEPYLLKIFRQRWYVAGRNVKENVVKTYALERMSDVNLLSDRFSFPEDFDPESYFNDSFGIMVDRSEVRDVAIRTDKRQAKYFRALPLHHSQREMVHDDFSIFRYRIRLTQDFVQELLSYGPRVTVLEPPELRAMITTSLRETLAAYGE
ncbi:MAG: WYL domain-containing protein [Muribaculaceae bacterium]|nr:WYL domain-containing protein [Muribaculaceae bacterium]